MNLGDLKQINQIARTNHMNTDIPAAHPAPCKFLTIVNNLASVELTASSSDHDIL